ncbi:MAG TPA: DMT family transporter [Bacteriovoracaceae bacterium]|nr:DMT family transporter [Bacteriovoracaceae bacterium]
MFSLVLSSFLFGLAYPLASVLIGDVDALEFAFHFLLVLTLLQLPLVLMKWREILKMTFQKEFSLLFVSGLIGTFLYWCEFSSLNVGLPISHLTFLSLTVPAWTLLYEYVRGRGTGWNLNKWVIALIGSAILIAPNSKGQFSAAYLLPIFTSLLMAFWIIYSKKAQENGISPVVCAFFNDFFSLIGITFFIYIKGRGHSLTMPHNIDKIAYYAVLTGIIPNLLLFYGLKKTKVTAAASIIMLEPIFIGIATIVATNEDITFNLMAGVLFIVASNLPDHFLTYARRMAVVYSQNTFK